MGLEYVGLESGDVCLMKVCCVFERHLTKTCQVTIRPLIVLINTF